MNYIKLAVLVHFKSSSFVAQIIITLFIRCRARWYVSTRDVEQSSNARILLSFDAQSVQLSSWCCAMSSQKEYSSIFSARNAPTTFTSSTVSNAKNWWATVSIEWDLSALAKNAALVVAMLYVFIVTKPNASRHHKDMRLQPGDVSIATNPSILWPATNVQGRFIEINFLLVNL